MLPPRHLVEFLVTVYVLILIPQSDATVQVPLLGAICIAIALDVGRAATTGRS